MNHSGPRGSKTCGESAHISDPLARSSAEVYNEEVAEKSHPNTFLLTFTRRVAESEVIRFI
ncbi:MAG: hypothetical protein R3C05_06875 [Pirellulaceae bacterium]